jgi:hypothetical protein
MSAAVARHQSCTIHLLVHVSRGAGTMAIVPAVNVVETESVYLLFVRPANGWIAKHAAAEDAVHKQSTAKKAIGSIRRHADVSGDVKSESAHKASGWTKKTADVWG